MSKERIEFELSVDTTQMLTGLQGASRAMEGFASKVEDANAALAKQAKEKDEGLQVTPLTKDQEQIVGTGIFQDTGALSLYRNMSGAVSDLAKSFEGLMQASPNASESFTKPLYEVRSLVTELQSSLREIHFDASGIIPDELFNRMNYVQSRMRALSEDMKTYQESVSTMTSDTLKIWNNQPVRKGLQDRAASYVRSLKNDKITRDLDAVVAGAIKHSSIGPQLSQLGITDKVEQEKIVRSAIISGTPRTDRLNHAAYHTGEVRGVDSANYLFDRVPAAFAHAFMNEGQVPSNYVAPAKTNTQAQRVATYRALQQAVKNGNYSAFEFARQAGLVDTTNGRSLREDRAGHKMHWMDESKVTDSQLDYVGALAAIEAKHALESMPMYRRSVKKREDLDYLLQKDNKGFESAYEVMALDSRSVINPYLTQKNAALARRTSAVKNGWYTGEQMSVPKMKMRDLISIPQVTLSEDGRYFVNVNDRDNPFGAINYAFDKKGKGIEESPTDEWVTTGRSPILEALFGLRQKKGQPQRQFVNRSFGYGFDKEGNAIQGEPIVMQVLVDDLFQTDEHGRTMFSVTENNVPLLNEKKNANGLTRAQLLDKLVSRQATIQLRKQDENGQEIIPQTQAEKDEAQWGVLFTNATGGRARLTVAKMSDIKALDAEDDRRGLVRRTQFFNEMYNDPEKGLRILGVSAGSADKGLEEAEMDTVKAYAKYFDAARKMDSASVALEEVGGVTPKVASVNFKALYDYLDKKEGRTEEFTDRRFDGGQFHMPWVADRDFQGRLGMTKFYSMRGDFKKFFEQGGGTYVDDKGEKHAYLPGVGTANAEDYDAYLQFLKQITTRPYKTDEHGKPIINKDTGLPELEPVARLNAGIKRSTALSPVTVKNAKGEIVDKYGDIKTYGDLMDWVNAKFIDTMQGDIGILASGDTVSKSFTQNSQITLANYRKFFGKNAPNRFVNESLFHKDDKGNYVLNSGINPEETLVTLTPQQQTDYLYANTRPERGFGMRMMKESLNYTKQKHFLNPALASSIVITDEMVKESLENYRNELAALDDPQEIRKRLFSENDSLSRIVANNPGAIMDNKMVRARIEEHRNELQDKIAKGYLYLPGIQESFGAAASMYDVLGGWIKNVTGQEKLFGTAESLKLGPEEIYARTKDGGDTFLATRSPYAIGASLKIKNIFNRNAAETKRKEQFEKAMEEYGITGDSAIFNVQDFYKLNTGDFDGDLAFLLANDPSRFGSYIEQTAAQNGKVSKIMEDLNRKEKQARAMNHSKGTYNASFSGFVSRYAGAGRAMGSAYAAGQAARVLVPGVDQITQDQLAEVQAAANIMYGIAADRPKHPDIEEMTSVGKKYKMALGAGKTADRAVGDLLDIWNKPEADRDFSSFDIMKFRMPTYKDRIGLHMMEGARVARMMDPGAYANLEKAFDASLAQYADEPEAIRNAYRWYTDAFKARMTGQWQIMSGDTLGEGLHISTQLRALSNQAKAEAERQDLSQEDAAAALEKYKRYDEIASRFERRVGAESSVGMTRTHVKNRDELKDIGASWVSDEDYDTSEMQVARTAAEKLYRQQLLSGEAPITGPAPDKSTQDLARYYQKRRLIAQQMTSYNWSTASQFMPELTDNPIEHTSFRKNLAAGDFTITAYDPGEIKERFEGHEEDNVRSKYYLENTIRNILTNKNTTDPDALIGSLAHGIMDQYVAGRSEYRATNPTVDYAAEHAAGKAYSQNKLLESLRIMAGVSPASADSELLENMKAAGVGFKLTEEGKKKKATPDQLTLADFEMYQNLNAGQNNPIWRESYNRAKNRFIAMQNGQLNPIVDNFLNPLFSGSGDHRVVMAEGTFYGPDGKQLSGTKNSHGIPVHPTLGQTGGMFRLYQQDDGSFDERPLSFRFTPDLVTKDLTNASGQGGYSVIDYKSSFGSAQKGRIQAEFYAHLLEEKAREARKNPGDASLEPYAQFVDDEGKSLIKSTRIIDMFGESTGGQPYIYSSDYTEEMGQRAFDLVQTAWQNLSIAVRQGFMKQLGRGKIREEDLSLGKNRKLSSSRPNWFTAGTSDTDAGYNFELDDVSQTIDFLAEHDSLFKEALSGSELIDTGVKKKVYEALQAPKMAPNKEYLVKKLEKADEVIGGAASLAYKTGGTRFASKDKYTRTLDDLEKLYSEEDIKAINAYGDENKTQLAPDVAMMIKDSATNLRKREELTATLKRNALNNLPLDIIRAGSFVDQMSATGDLYEAYTGMQSRIEALRSQAELWKQDNVMYNGKFITDAEASLYGQELWDKMQQREQDEKNLFPLIRARNNGIRTDNLARTRKMEKIARKYGTDDRSTWSEADRNAYEQLKSELRDEEELKYSVDLTEEEKRRIAYVGNRAGEIVKGGQHAQEQYNISQAKIAELQERANQNFIETAGNAVRNATVSTNQLLYGKDAFLTTFEQNDLREAERMKALISGRAGLLKMDDSIRQLLDSKVINPDTNREEAEIQGDLRTKLEAYSASLKDKVKEINDAMTQVPDDVARDVTRENQNREIRQSIESLRRNEQIDNIESTVSGRLENVFALTQQRQSIQDQIRTQQEKISRMDSVSVPEIQKNIQDLEASKKGKSPEEQAEIDKKIQEEQAKILQWSADKPQQEAELQRLRGVNNEIGQQITSTLDRNRLASESEILDMMLNGERRTINPFAQADYSKEFQEAVERRRIAKGAHEAQLAYDRGEINQAEYTSRISDLAVRRHALNSGAFIPQSTRNFEISQKVESEQDRIRGDRAKAFERLGAGEITQSEYDSIIGSLDRQQRAIDSGRFGRRLRDEQIRQTRARELSSADSMYAFETEFYNEPRSARIIANQQANKFNEQVKARRAELKDMIDAIPDDDKERAKEKRQYQEELDSLNAMNLNATFGRYLGTAQANENLRNIHLGQQERSINQTFAGANAPVSLQDAVNSAIANANAQLEEYIKAAGLDETQANNLRSRYANTANISRDIIEQYQRQLEAERVEETKKSSLLRERLTGQKATSHDRADMAVESLREDVRKHRDSLMRRAEAAEANGDYTERDRLLNEAVAFDNADYAGFRRRTFSDIERERASERYTNARRNEEFMDKSSGARLTAAERVARRMQDLENGIDNQIAKLERDEANGVYTGRENELMRLQAELLYFDRGAARSRMMAEEEAADRSFYASNAAKGVRTTGSLENRSLNRAEETAVAQARLIQEREDYLAQQIQSKQMDEAQANAYRAQYNDPYLMGIATQQTDYAFGQRELTNQMNSRLLQAELSGQAMSNNDLVEQKYDALRKKRDAELERIRKEEGTAAESAAVFSHPEWQDPALYALAQTQVQQTQNEANIQAANMIAAVQDQGAAGMRQLVYSRDQFQRQRRRQYVQSRLGSNLAALDDRSIALEQGIASKQDAIAQSNRNIALYQARLQRTDLSDKERTALQGSLDAERDKISNYNQQIQESRNQIEQLQSPAAKLGAVFGTVGQSINMLAQRLGRRMFMKALAEAKKFVVEYNRTMTEIQMITLKSDSQMSTLGDGLIAKAKELKVSISDITKSAATLYRQGLSDQEVNDRLETIAKFSKVSGTKTADATKLITVAINTGLVTDATHAADVVTALGDNAATNAQQIEKGIEKAGAAAAADGTTFEELAAMLTAITSTTQIGGNVAGRTLNTIFGRMNKIGTNELVYDENGRAISGSAVSKLLAAQGVMTYDENGNKRSSFDVLADLSKKWDSISDAEQQQLATAIAGTRQYSNFAAIMQGMTEGKIDEYMALVGESSGITDKKYDVYVKSLDASVANLKNTFDSLINTMTSNGALTGFLDTISNMIQGVENLSGSLGGLGAMLATVIPVFAGFVMMKAGLMSGHWGLALAGVGTAAVGAIIADSAGSKETVSQRLSSQSEAYQENQQTRTKDLERLEILDKQKIRTEEENTEYFNLSKSLSVAFGLVDSSAASTISSIEELATAIKEAGNSSDGTVEAIRKAKEEQDKLDWARNANDQAVDIQEELDKKFEENEVAANEYYPTNEELLSLGIWKRDENGKFVLNDNARNKQEKSILSGNLADGTLFLPWGGFNGWSWDAIGNHTVSTSAVIKPALSKMYATAAKRGYIKNVDGSNQSSKLSVWEDKLMHGKITTEEMQGMLDYYNDLLGDFDSFESATQALDRDAIKQSLLNNYHLDQYMSADEVEALAGLAAENGKENIDAYLFGSGLTADEKIAYARNVLAENGYKPTQAENEETGKVTYRGKVYDSQELATDQQTLDYEEYKKNNKIDTYVQLGERGYLVGRDEEKLAIARESERQNYVNENMTAFLNDSYKNGRLWYGQLRSSEELSGMFDAYKGAHRIDENELYTYTNSAGQTVTSADKKIVDDAREADYATSAFIAAQNAGVLQKILNENAPEDIHASIMEWYQSQFGSLSYEDFAETHGFGTAKEYTYNGTPYKSRQAAEQAQMDDFWNQVGEEQGFYEINGTRYTNKADAIVGARDYLQEKWNEEHKIEDLEGVVTYNGKEYDSVESAEIQRRKDFYTDEANAIAQATKEDAEAADVLHAGTVTGLNAWQTDNKNAYALRADAMRRAMEDAGVTDMASMIEFLQGRGAADWKYLTENNGDFARLVDMIQYDENGNVLNPEVYNQVMNALRTNGRDLGAPVYSASEKAGIAQGMLASITSGETGYLSVEEARDAAQKAVDQNEAEIQRLTKERLSVITGYQYLSDEKKLEYENEIRRNNPMLTRSAEQIAAEYRVYTEDEQAYLKNAVGEKLYDKLVHHTASPEEIAFAEMKLGNNATGLTDLTTTQKASLSANVYNAIKSGDISAYEGMEDQTRAAHMAGITGVSDLYQISTLLKAAGISYEDAISGKVSAEDVNAALGGVYTADELKQLNLSVAQAAELSKYTSASNYKELSAMHTGLTSQNRSEVIRTTQQTQQTQDKIARARFALDNMDVGKSFEEIDDAIVEELVNTTGYTKEQIKKMWKQNRGDTKNTLLASIQAQSDELNQTLIDEYNIRMSGVAGLVLEDKDYSTEELASLIEGFDSDFAAWIRLIGLAIKDGEVQVKESEESIYTSLTDLQRQAESKGTKKASVAKIAKDVIQPSDTSDYYGLSLQERAQKFVNKDNNDYQSLDENLRYLFTLAAQPGSDVTEEDLLNAWNTSMYGEGSVKTQYGYAARKLFGEGGFGNINPGSAEALERIRETYRTEADSNTESPLVAVWDSMFDNMGEVGEMLKKYMAGESLPENFGEAYQKWLADVDFKNLRDASEMAELVGLASSGRAEDRGTASASVFDKYRAIGLAQYGLNNGNTSENRGYISALLGHSDEYINDVLSRPGGEAELQQEITEKSDNLKKQIKTIIEHLVPDIAIDTDTASLDGLKEQLTSKIDDTNKDLINLLLDWLNIFDGVQTPVQSLEEIVNENSKETVAKVDAMAEIGKALGSEGDYANFQTFQERMEHLNSQSGVNLGSANPQLQYMINAVAHGSTAFTQDMINAAYQNDMYGRTSSPETQQAILNNLFGNNMNAQNMVDTYLSHAAGKTSEDLAWMETYNSLENVEELTKAMTSEEDAVRQTTKELEDYNDEVGPRQAQYLQTYGDYTDEVADSMRNLNKGGKSAVQEIAKMKSGVLDLKDSMTAISKARGKSGKGLDSTTKSMIASYLGVDEKTVGKMTKKELDGILDKMETAVNEEFNSKYFQPILEGAFEDINKAIDAGEITYEQVVDVVTRVNESGDMSEFVALLESINSDYAAVADSMAGDIVSFFINIIKSMQGDKARVDVKASTSGSSGSVGSGKSYNKGGGGGGGKSAADKLIERQGHEQKELEHKQTLLESKYSHYVSTGDYDSAFANLTEQKGSYQNIGDLYLRQIEEIKAEMAKTTEGSDDWYKLRDQLFSLEEAAAETADKLRELNVQATDLAETIHSNTQTRLEHRGTMIETKGSYYQLQQQNGDKNAFENWLVAQRALQSDYDVQIADKQDYRKARLAEMEKYEQNDEEWIKLRDQVYQLDEEIASLQNSKLQNQIEMNAAIVSQIGTDLTNAKADTEHRINMGSTIASMYNNHEMYSQYRSTLSSQNNSYNAQIQDYQTAMARMKERIALLPKESEAWYSARDAIYEYEEAILSATNAIDENNRAIQQSMVQERTSQYEEDERDLQHALSMYDKMMERAKFLGDDASYLDLIQNKVKEYTAGLKTARKDLASLEELAKSGKITDQQAWDELRGSIQGAQEKVAEYENALLSLDASYNKTVFENTREDFNKVNSRTEHELNLIRYAKSYYQNRGELSMYGGQLENEKSTLVEQRDNYKAYIASLRKQLNKIDDVRQAGGINYIDEETYEAVNQELMKAEEQYNKILVDIDKINEEMDKNKEKIRQTQVTLEKMLDKEIKARIQKAKNMLSAEVDLQNNILNVIKQRYQEEWDIIKKDIEKKKKALNDEKALINERLQARKNAQNQEDKEEELAEYKRQLALISGDQTRTKDVKELQRKIEDLEKELAWKVAEDEANAAIEAIDEQISALDSYINQKSQDLADQLKDNNNLINDERFVAAFRADSAQGYIDILKEYSKDYQYATAEARQKMEQNWEETWKAMKGITDTYWDDPEFIKAMGSLKDFVAYFKKSDEYLNASDTEKESLIYKYTEAYESYVNANKIYTDSKFADTEHAILDTLIEMKDWTYKVEFPQDTKDTLSALLGGTSDYDTGFRTGQATTDINSIVSQIDSKINDIESHYGEGVDDTSTSDTGTSDTDTSTSSSDSSGSPKSDKKPSTTGKEKKWHVHGTDQQGRQTVYGVEYDDETAALQAAAKGAMNGWTNLQISYYKHGGLVDYTGPAWVDGTKTRPEAFLSAYDTETVRAMVDALNYVRVNSGYVPDTEGYAQSNSVGDITITINQAELKSDADLDELARAVGQKFTKELSKKGFTLTGYAF